MRIIDADAVLDILRNFDRQHADLNNGSEDFVYGVETAIEVIEDAPTVDIVRCVECEYYYKDHYFECALHTASVKPDGFCGFGERRKDD